ncbi:hypothetical protein OJ253_2818 [Cryptosporidium canis]|uniref:Uncharacterized protein n=1 Tax=Cryptosporidium canis TaxID=195482 RepID=A0A9D5HXU7_9CRYT|nr:hypothetical protein OJ253_2818 [Cryptosporidium canis]
MTYNSNMNQVVCQCGRQDRFLQAFPQSSNSRMMKGVQQSGCGGCVTPLAHSNMQNCCGENQTGCMYFQRAQHCCVCELSRKVGLANQGNLLCSCCSCPMQQYSPCQCGGTYQSSNPVAPSPTQITEIVPTSSANGSGTEGSIASLASSGPMLVSTNLNSIPLQGQHVSTPSELHLKSAPINPEMINIALSGQTPESLSISIDSRGVITLGVNNHPAPAPSVASSNPSDESRNRIRNALGDRH